MFWGEERLRDELPKLLLTDWEEERLEKAAYRLRIGPEVYVSPTGEPGDPRNKPKARLEEEEPFTIPAGQFGFILTEEKVKVPSDALAFISIRARYKFRGLVNVSGFHVDPGYEGRLMFSVFNAGPGPVHLARGEECFLIFYADLVRPGPPENKRGNYNSIPSELMAPLATGLQSLSSVDARVTTLEREQAVLKWAIALLVGAVISFGLSRCSKPPVDAKTHGDAAATSAPPSGQTVRPIAAQPPRHVQ